MDLKSLGTPKVLELVLELKQYPILTRQIRERMRQEIFQRGIISPANLEQEVREKAIASQLREGLTDPLVEEPWDVWQQRLELIRTGVSSKSSRKRSSGEPQTGKRCSPSTPNWHPGPCSLPSAKSTKATPQRSEFESNITSERSSSCSPKG